MNGSGTAVLDGNYVLTARHLVTTGGGIAGSLRPASDLQFQLGGMNYSAVAVYAEFGGDVALVQLSAPCPMYVELYTGASGSEFSQVFTAIGFGQNDSDGDGRWGPGGLGVKRAFQNRVEGIIDSGVQGSVLRYDFDMTSGDAVGVSEGLNGNGDSGGGLFLWNSGKWQLAGVLSSAGDPLDGATGSAIQVSAYSAQIMAAVPEPGYATVLCGLGLGLLVRGNRRVRN